MPAGRKRPWYVMALVLGINSYFEHPSVALIRDDEVLYAVEDERFTGIKHGRKYSPYRAYLPVDAMYRALVDSDTDPDSIDEIAYSYDRGLHLLSLWGCFTGARFDGLRDELNGYLSSANVHRMLRRGYEIPMRYRPVLRPERLGRIPYREWPHHLSHAASAFYPSGYDRALVLVSDGAGEHATTTAYLGEHGRLSRIGGVNLPHSLGIVYSMTTRHLGFEPFADEFKVMGLAAYGEPTRASEFERLIQLTPRGGFRIDVDAMRNLGALLGPARRVGGELDQVHRDIARSLQERLESALVHVVTYYASEIGANRLCLAGGTFLNCVANGRIARIPGIDEVYVQPAAHDAGTAVGAALLSSIRRGGPAFLRTTTAALGSSYTDAQISAVLDESATRAERHDDDNLVASVAARLAAGQVVAVFRGRMEFGPRALGMRSLLADPRPPDMRDRLNRIKGREGFRPVAPIVLGERFEEYFDGVRNPYMLFTARVRPEVRSTIPSVVHVDGTSRVQSLEGDADPWLRGLVEEFDRLTGIPMLINTSFNVLGKPIIESPLEALACLSTTRLDALVIGNYLVERSK